MSEKSSEGRVSSIVEASFLVRRIALPAQIGDTIKRQIDRASRRIPFWSASRVKDVWYADPRIRIGADELADLRDIARDEAAAREARNEFRQLQDRIARIEAALGVSDPEFHSDAIDALRQSSGGEDRSVGG